MQKHLPRDLYREEIKLTKLDIYESSGHVLWSRSQRITRKNPPCPVVRAVIRQKFQDNPPRLLIAKPQEGLKAAYPDAQFVLWIGDAPWLISAAGEEACSEWDEGNLPKPCTFEIGEVPDGR